MTKKLSLKTLCAAVSSVMALTTFTQAKASDIEIYQAAKSGNTTLMLLLDISGSMNLGYSAMDDYNLTAGDGPQDVNDYRRIPSPILDELAKLPENMPPNNITMKDNRGHYRQEWTSSITNLGRFSRAQVNAEISDYFAWSPGSYCQTRNMATASRRGAGWQQNFITEAEGVTGRGYVRQYCRVPVDATTIDAKYWANTGGVAVGSKWIMDPIIGCPMYTDAGVITTTESNATHRRCYSRISRLKDALWDVINGNPANGIAPLDDDVILGMATLGVYLRNVGPQGWRPDEPLLGRMGWFHRSTGAIRVPARPLGYIDPTTGRTQRQLLMDLVQDRAIFEAYGSTPTARSFTETASYLLGTNTTDDFTLRETHLMDANWAHRSCIRWGAPVPLSVLSTNWDTSQTPPLQCLQWELASNLGVNNDINYIDGYPVPADRADEPRIWRTTNQPRIYYGYTPRSGSGFAHSSNDSKTADGKRYQAPASVVDQKNPECSGQGIYVLSDGAPSTLFNEENTMKLALGSKGSGFSCRNTFPDTDVRSDWACMNALSEALLDPDRNPAGISFKTAVVGFAREYTDQTFTPYNHKKTKDENLAGIPTTDNSTMARFARWGINGGGGWYAGSSSKSVVDSINSFVKDLSADIPEVVTGQPFVPIDPLNPLTYMNNAYYGSFKPKAGSSVSFWSGDLNKYGIKDQIMYGSDGTSPLFNPSNGLLNANVLGYWGTGATSKLPLRSGDGRQLFTNISGSSNAALTKVTLDELYGSTPLAARTSDRNAWLNLLGYSAPLAGTPVNRVDLPATTEVRQLGAIMHSTPIILTQSGKITRSGSKLDTSVRKDYILYGSTQGILHVIDGETGVEKVAFVPNEMMSSPTSKENFQAANSTVGQLTYGIDGQWTTYTQYINATEGGFTVNGATGATSTNLNGKGVQWAYGGLRMGGRSYYGLDLSNIDNPQIKFHINPNAASAGTPLSYMGQSWSKPTLGFVRWNGERRLVMFVGGGYDMGYENTTYDQTNGEGAGVYMFDAHNGELLWWGSSHAITSSGGAIQATNNSNLKYSVVSNIATYDRNNDGLVDNLYFGDLGGQVFRVDLDNTYNHTGGENLVSRVVRLYNGHKTGGLSPRFYDAPSFSAHSGLGAEGQFGIVSIASGNKSSPVSAKNAATSAKDALFVIYDQDVLRSGITKKTATPYVTDANVDNLVEMTSAIMTSGDESKAVKVVDGSTRNQGWKYYLSGTPGQLKGNNTPRVVDNFLFLNTYTPEGGTVTQDSCGAGILGESYQELFCLPGGVCTKKQLDVLKIDSPVTTTVGSFARNLSGTGNIQTTIAPGTTNGINNEQKTLDPVTTDCSIAANASSPDCLTQLSSITNKPVRWYEDTPRS